MENDLEDDDWEDLEEAIGEYGEEEGEYVPPGYQAADGPFKSYCTCENFVTCNFCSWFYKIKDCKRHGQATRRPFKPCTCPSSSRDDEEKLPSLEQLQQSLESLKGPQAEPVRTCVCTIKIPQPIQCECLNFLQDKPTKKEKPAKNVRVQFGDVDSENDKSEMEMFEEDFMEEDGEWETMEDGGTIGELDKTADRKPGPITKKKEKTCTCETLPLPRSGSSTVLETDSSEASSTSSFKDLLIGDGLPDDEDTSELTPSEESSAESAAFDPTRCKWTTYASDRSVDSVTEDELDESEIDRIAAHWGIRHIYGRLPRATSKPKEEFREKPSKAGPTRQYLLVQHNHTKVFKQTCKKKKDKAKPYYYRLMEL